MKPKKVILVVVLVIILCSLVVVFTNAGKKEREANEASVAARVDTVKAIGSNGQYTDNSNLETSGEKIVLKDKYFITQLNDIYYNIDEYIGKQIEIEGFPMNEGNYCFVGRYGPGCCSNDNYAYIEYEYPQKLSLTNEKDWIKVNGTIKQGFDGEISYIYIDASNVEKLATRGNDTVSN